MNYTNFDPKTWGNESFVKIGYDNQAKQLCIVFLDEKAVYFKGVEEKIVFQFIISTEKESFLQEFLWPKYRHEWVPSSLLVQTP
ncbi:hypothetical protein GCM10007216_23990 [Thalassobacillus devorans]|uniref:KTSC domain-containing protein n=1 Tax=Thalassobacillus devorans TaxID=279813 RepID=A0ABQ1P6X7_9BACI|nr:KTSC domain-containing protein [Thalassobacillus devorans]NIK29740.1 hypothetical protein [Thalassobacillus devorans]GGC92430.1 hypothetical protein GCM10007216_23990 [Thalassobacillus devorans]